MRGEGGVRINIAVIEYLSQDIDNYKVFLAYNTRPYKNFDFVVNIWTTKSKPWKFSDPMFKPIDLVEYGLTLDEIKAIATVIKNMNVMKRLPSEWVGYPRYYRIIGDILIGIDGFIYPHVKAIIGVKTSGYQTYWAHPIVSPAKYWTPKINMILYDTLSDYIAQKT